MSSQQYVGSNGKSGRRPSVLVMMLAVSLVQAGNHYNEMTARDIIEVLLNAKFDLGKF